MVKGMVCQIKKFYLGSSSNHSRKTKRFMTNRNQQKLVIDFQQQLNYNSPNWMVVIKYQPWMRSKHRHDRAETKHNESAPQASMAISDHYTVTSVHHQPSPLLMIVNDRQHQPSFILINHRKTFLLMLSEPALTTTNHDG